MKSKWSDLKPEAIKLRRKGFSIAAVEKTLGIPRSTLSGWFKDIHLTPEQKAILDQNWRNGLVKARKGAVKWHNQQKEARLQKAQDDANSIVNKIDTTNKETLELALAVLYLAEGSKKNIETALGSSDSITLRFFLTALETLFDFNRNSVRCELYLRADQNPEELKKYWAKELSIPLVNFKQISVDKRSLGKETYDYYKGVCSLRCGNVAIRRRLVYVAEKYFAIIGGE